jgi:hypothetical protein
MSAFGHRVRELDDKANGFSLWKNLKAQHDT